MVQLNSQSFPEIDQLIRTGLGAEARKILRKLPIRSLSRESLSEAASLAWRAGMADLGVQILNPIVRPTGRRSYVATDVEKIEYAACLIKIGATEEGLELLNEIVLEEHPKAMLYKSFANFTQWDYRSSIPLLLKYVESTSDPYQQLVGKVNLAAAYVNTRDFAKAKRLLDSILSNPHDSQWHLLHGNALELSATNHILQGQFDEAEDLLSRAENLLKSSESLDAFFVKKWQTILSAIKGPLNRRSQTFGNLRKLAKERGHWETLRDCDRLEAIHCGDEKLFDHVYFGTPYENFRALLVSEFPKKKELAENYIWAMKGEASPDKACDIASGEMKKGIYLKTGQLPHQLLVALCRDFYRPHRLAALHFQLFPGDHFNPNSSSRRVFEIIRRLRNWFAEHSIPLTVQEKNSLYWLSSEGSNCSLRVPRQVRVKEKWEAVLERLHHQFAQEPFSLAEAAQTVEMPPRSTRRVLEQARQAKAVERIGQGRSIRYRLPSALTK